MSNSNYPDNIRDYDNNPASPFYDDKGEEAWCEKRYCEIMDDVKNELNSEDADVEALADIVFSNYNDKDQSQMVKLVIEFVEKLASDQSDEEWEGRDE